MRTLLAFLALALPMTALAPAAAAPAALAAWDMAEDDGDVPGYAICGGVAPDTTACDTGSHVRTGNIRHAARAPPGYTGSVQSALEWSGGARLYTCNYLIDGTASCAGSGTFPPVGAAFTHTCKSSAYGTTTPGGSGPWGCTVNHGVLFATGL